MTLRRSLGRAPATRAVHGHRRRPDAGGSPKTPGARGARLVLCEANERVHGKRLRAGVIGGAGPACYAEDLSGALALAV